MLANHCTGHTSVQPSLPDVSCCCDSDGRGDKNKDTPRTIMRDCVTVDLTHDRLKDQTYMHTHRAAHKIHHQGAIYVFLLQKHNCPLQPTVMANLPSLVMEGKN
jgi:hypothetical protein